MTIERLRQLASGENSIAFDYGFTCPTIPKPDISRSTLVLLALSMGFGSMGFYGDTIVAGTGGRLIALCGILGVIIVFPALVTRCIGRGAWNSFFKPDSESDRFRR